MGYALVNERSYHALQGECRCAWRQVQPCRRLAAFVCIAGDITTVPHQLLFIIITDSVYNCTAFQQQQL
jgi:hypothetical protein